MCFTVLSAGDTEMSEKRSLPSRGPAQRGDRRVEQYRWHSAGGTVAKLSWMYTVRELWTLAPGSGEPSQKTSLIVKGEECIGWTKQTECYVQVHSWR